MHISQNITTFAALSTLNTQHSTLNSQLTLSLSIFHSILQLLFPRCCPMCGRVIDDGEECICANCMQTLPRTEQATQRDNITEQLFSSDFSRFQRGAAFLFYDKGHPIRKAIHSMKFHEQPEIATLLAKEAAYDFLQTDFFEGIDIILPIPLHPKRLRERGFNQSEYIARALSEVTKIPMNTTLLTRRKHTAQQALLQGDERKNNMVNAFEVNHPEELYRKHILLVDDLITSGATMRACMQALQPCRGAHYSVFALCKAR
ncbi:MAG: ComF family protein [Paludibacteraceae bacterium]